MKQNSIFSFTIYHNIAAVRPLFLSKVYDFVSGELSFKVVWHQSESFSLIYFAVSEEYCWWQL